MTATPTEVQGYAQSRVLVQSLIAHRSSPADDGGNRKIEIFIAFESIVYQKNEKFLQHAGTAFQAAHFAFVTAETPLPSKRQ
jgi:hypothetical protein